MIKKWKSQGKKFQEKHGNPVSSWAMSLPPYYLEVVLAGGMTCVNAMMIYGGRILQVLFESFLKGTGGFSYVIVITGEVTTLEPVYAQLLLFVDHGVFVFRGDH